MPGWPALVYDWSAGELVVALRSERTVPTTPDELTDALRGAGTLERGAVVRVAINERIQTSISNLWFLEAAYTRDASPELPTRLLIKWPIEPAPVRESGATELTFYRELAAALPSPPIVRCLATAPASSSRQWLILEDLRPSHTNPPWPERPGRRDLEAAVSVLAMVHAQWWEAPTLGATVGELHTEASVRSMVKGIAAHLPSFFEDLGDTLPIADRSLLEAVFSSALRPWLRLIDRRALTVVHGDAHTWNFLYQRSGDGLPYLVDWQLWHPDVGARDLAFMIALHWDRTTRQELERPLLQVYYQQLLREGITGYAFDDLWLDYRRCTVRNLTFPIIFWARGLPPETWRHRLDCALAACRDLGSLELL